MNLKSVLSVGLILSSLLLNISSACQSSSSLFKTRIYTPHDGLSHSYVLAVMQDSNRYLWVGTMYGLGRFDGQRFTNIVVNNNSKNIYGTGMTEEDGKLLLWTRSDGFFTLDGKKVTLKNDSTRSIPIRGYEGIRYWSKIDAENGSFYNYRDDVIYVGKNGNIKKFSTFLPAYSFVVVRGYWNNQLYLFTNRGFYTYKNGNVRTLFEKQLAGKYIYSALRDSQKRIWVSTREDGIMISEPDEERVLNHRIMLSNNLISGFYEDREGNMWIATFEGLVKVEDLHYDLFSKDKYPFLWDLNVVSKDKKGNILLFSETNGFIQQKKDSFLFSKKNAFKGQLIDALCYDDHNRIWCISRQMRLLFFDGKNVFDFTNKVPAYSREFNLDIAYDNYRKKVWVMRDSLALGDERGFSVFKDNNNTVISNPKLLLTLQGGKVVIVTMADELFLIDEKNNIHNLNKNNQLLPEMIHKIFSDSSGNIWVSYLGSGLLKCKIVGDNNLVITEKFTRDNGLMNEVIKSMAFDKEGRLWLATMAGITILDFKNELEPGVPLINQIGNNDNIPASGLEYGRLVCDNNGDMWFSSQYSVMKFHVKKMKFVSAPPPVTIEKVSLDVHETDWRKYTDSLSGSFFIPYKPVLKYYENTITFNFKAVSMVGNGDFQYSYMVKGLNNNWSKSSTNNSITLVKLNPGTYTFLVRARKSNSDWSEPTSFTFTIRPAFWQYWWFNPLLVTAFAGFIYWLYRFRIKQIRKEVNIRRRIASDLHDDIGSTLSSISYYSEAIRKQVKETNPGAISLLDKMENASADTVNAMSDIVWATNPSYDKGSDLLTRMQSYASEICGIKKIFLEFEADKSFENTKLNMSIRKNAFLIFKEAVNNAVKYSGCTKLNVHLSQDEMQINDNGKGFDVKADFMGNGLKNMRQRASEIKAVIEITSRQDEGCLITLKF